jgi:hypothetical protein
MNVPTAALRHCMAGAAVLASAAAYAQTDPLPSWNAGETKAAILKFVEATADPASAEFVEPSDRIATFDNDGTLWSEQPLYWGTAGDGARMGIIVHHTDAVREWAYDRDSDIGHLEKALDQAPAEGWIVVDMAKDWGTIWPAP